MSHEGPPPLLTRCDGAPLTVDDFVWTATTLGADAPQTDRIVINTSGESPTCMSFLTGIECSEFAIRSTMVLGVNALLEPEWQRPGRPALTRTNIVNASVVDVDDADIFVYLDAAPGGDVSLVSPTDVCQVTDIWIKNRGSAMTITGATDLIDGAASYPLALNESAHLYFSFATSEWFVI